MAYIFLNKTTMMWTFWLFFFWTIRSIDSCEQSQIAGNDQSPVKLYPFVKFNSVRLSEFQEKVNDSQSYETTNALGCARLIARVCCKPMGFLYDPASRACQPIKWADGLEIALQDLGPGDSSLYSYVTAHCTGSGYLTFREKIGNYTVTTCIRPDNNPQQYHQAISYCKTSGGFLATAKTQERLALLLKLNKDMHSSRFWVGLRRAYRAPTFKWADDGTALTQQQQEQMFPPGLPSYGINYDCVSSWRGDGTLLDVVCLHYLLSFCEKKPGC